MKDLFWRGFSQTIKYPTLSPPVQGSWAITCEPWGDTPSSPRSGQMSPQLLTSRHFLTPERGDVLLELAILICVASHLTNLGFCGMQRVSGGSELWDEMPYGRCINFSKANFDFSWVFPLFVLSWPVTTAGIWDMGSVPHRLQHSFSLSVSHWQCAHVPSAFTVSLDTAVSHMLLSPAPRDPKERGHISNPAHTKTWGRTGRI